MSKSDPNTKSNNLTDFEVRYVEQWLETHKRSAHVVLLLRAMDDSPKWSGELNDYLHDATNGAWTVDEKSLYRALRRLESQGLAAHEKQSVAGSGAKRKVFSITDSGRRILGSIHEAVPGYSA